MRNVFQVIVVDPCIKKVMHFGVIWAPLVRWEVQKTHLHDLYQNIMGNLWTLFN
jgi:hypothetical protein